MPMTASPGPSPVALATIADDLRQALTEAGIALHDCDGPGRPAGGCCLTPTDGHSDYPAGIIVGWTCADTLAAGGVDGDRHDIYQTVQDTMSEALWAVLESFDFPAVPFGNFALPLVTGPRPPLEAPPRPWDIEDLSHLGGPPAPTGEPLYGEPVTGVVMSADGRLRRGCAACGRLAEQLHYPQARDSSAVCCACFTGSTLIADDEHPEGWWTDLGRCPGHDTAAPAPQ